MFATFASDDIIFTTNEKRYCRLKNVSNNRTKP